MCAGQSAPPKDEVNETDDGEQINGRVLDASRAEDPRPLGAAASHNRIVPMEPPMTMINRRSILLGAVGSTIPQIGFVNACKPTVISVASLGDAFPVVQNASFNESLSPTATIGTMTASNSPTSWSIINGNYDGYYGIDNSGNIFAQSPVPGSATNPLLQSHNFETTWNLVVGGTTTMGTAAATAPDGTLTGQLIGEDTTLNLHRINQTLDKAAGSLAYTLSVYAKANSPRTRCVVQVEDNAGNGAYCTYDLVGGATVGGATGTFGTGWTIGSTSIVPVGNGWHRCVITATSNTSTFVRATLGNDAGSGQGVQVYNYTGGGPSVGVFIWGAQLEQASNVGPYAHTTSSASMSGHAAGTYALTVQATNAFGSGTGTAKITAPTAGPIFASVSIGGGGYSTGIQIVPDGTMCCRVDVFNGYISNTAAGNVWTPAFDVNNAPGAGSVWGFANGENGGTWHPHNSNVGADTYEIQIAPSNSQVIYALWMGLMLVSQNRGSTWTVMSNFPTINYNKDANTSDVTRTYQKKMAVDPNNANCVVIGTPANGVYITQNGLSGASATFTSVAGIAAPTSRNGITGVSFDTTSGTTRGFTNRIAVCSSGNGVYISTNAGSSFSLSSGSPTAVTDGLFANGNYYAASSGAVYMLQSGIWYNLGNGGGGGMWCIAIDPNNANHLAGMGNNGGSLNQAMISGTTAAWYGPYYNSGVNPAPTSDVGWMNSVAPEWTGYFFAAGGCAFDPKVSNRLWVSYGYGVGYFDIPSNTASSTTNIGMTTKQNGIESTDGVCVASIPGYSHPLMAVDDQQVFQIVDSTAPASSSIPQLGARRNNAACWCMDWSQSNLGVVAALCSGYYVGSTNYSGYSTNGGSSWTQFQTHPFTTDGGMITCTDSSHFVAVAVGTQTPVYTADGGSSWATVTGLPPAAWQQGMFNRANTFCNDAAGYIYAYQYQHGLYKSTNGGATFSLVNRRTAVCTNNFAAKLKAVPGNAGYLFITTGFSFSGRYPSSNGFYYTTDGGTSWKKILNVLDVWAFGFGQAYPGYTYPTLWIYGFVNNGGAGYKWGLWRSRDLGVSDWTRICVWDGGLAIFPSCLDGDMNDHTKVYISYGGNGFRYGRNIT